MSDPEYVWGPQERLLIVWSLREAMGKIGKVDRRRRENRKPCTRVQDALRAEEWEILLKIQAERDRA